MSGVNKVIVLGRLGKDPETNGPATKLTVATSEKWKDKEGQDQERTEWHNIVAFGKMGEVMSKYLTKGSSVYIEGKLQTDSYEKDGVKKYSTKIIAQSFQFVNGGNRQAVDSTDTGPAFDQKEDIPF